MDQLVKLVVYVPEQDAERVRLALGAAGAGHIGGYDHCASETRVKGYFRPLPGAKPAIGKVGDIEEVDEVKLETACRESELPKALMAMRDAHPYEEIAYDIVPLLNDKYATWVPKKAQ